MMAGWLARSLPLLAVLCGFTALCPAPSRAAGPIEIVTVILSQSDVSPGREQIVQVTLRNTGGSAAPVGVRLTTRNESGRAVGDSAQRAVTLNPYDEQRILFTIRAPSAAGAYRVQLGLYTSNFGKRLDADEPPFYASFTVGGVGQTAAVPLPPPPPTTRSNETAALEPRPSYPPPSGLSFELPDVMWENFDFSPSSFLIGDTGRVRADLRNVGGDIMRDISVQVRYFNTRIPNRIEPIAESSVVALAPGEKIELEWEFSFPDDALLGEYRVILQATGQPGTREANTENNRITAERAIQLNNIRLVFPDPNYIFDEAGLFLFRWESRLYEEFKVQVGVDEGFQEKERYFDIPQGNKWTKDQEVVPLEGELPGMARGLMQRTESNTVYWRVVGRNTTTNRTGYSRPQAFTIQGRPASERPGPDALPEPAEVQPSAPPPGGPASPGAPLQSEQGNEAPNPPGAPSSPGGASAPAPPQTPQPQAPQSAAPQSPGAQPSAPQGGGSPGAPAPPSTPQAPPPPPPAAAPSRPEPGGVPPLPPVVPQN
jgi:hypothetical protein